MDFWDKVEQCEHEWNPNYAPWIPCSTPLCGGCYEQHCLKCGVYKSECPCGCENGMSGWSYAKWLSHNRKKYPLFYINNTKGETMPYT